MRLLESAQEATMCNGTYETVDWRAIRKPAILSVEHYGERNAENGCDHIRTPNEHKLPVPGPAIVKEEKNERARHESVEKRTSHESEHFRIRHVQTAELNNDSSPTDKACTILIDPHALQRTK